jgi:hypothetical protein
MSVSAVVRRSLGLLILLSAACGDDGGDNMPAGDAGMMMKDGGPTDAGQGSLPRSDARVAPPDPIRACDPGDNAACGAGETCDLLIRISASNPKPTIYNGCVPATRERGAGDPCDPNPTNNAPLRLPGLVDDVYRDRSRPMSVSRLRVSPSIAKKRRPATWASRPAACPARLVS